MTIYRYEIPIEDSYNNENFFTHIYIDSEECPTFNMVKEILQKALDEEVKFLEKLDESDYRLYYQGDLSDYEKCLKVIETCEDWPILNSLMYSINSFCSTKYGRAPLTVTKITVLKC